MMWKGDVLATRTILEPRCASVFFLAAAPVRVLPRRSASHVTVYCLVRPALLHAIR